MIKKLFSSQICIGVFAISFISALFLIPRNALEGWYLALSLVFMTLFALNMTCFVYAVKERVHMARAGKSTFLGVLATVLGISALQVCGVGAHLCGAAIGSGILFVVLPGAAIHIFNTYAVHMVVLAIIAQIIALYFMNCFKNNKKQ